MYKVLFWKLQMFIFKKVLDNIQEHRRLVIIIYFFRPLIKSAINIVYSYPLLYSMLATRDQSVAIFVYTVLTLK